MKNGDEGAGTEQFLIPAPAAHLYMRMGVCSLSENSHQTQVCCVWLNEDQPWVRFYPALLQQENGLFPLDKRREGHCHCWDPFPSSPQNEGEVGTDEGLLSSLVPPVVHSWWKWIWRVWLAIWKPVNFFQLVRFMLMNQSPDLMYLKTSLWATLIEQLKHYSIAN